MITILEVCKLGPLGQLMGPELLATKSSINLRHDIQLAKKLKGILLGEEIQDQKDGEEPLTMMVLVQVLASQSKLMTMQFIVKLPTMEY